jgi:hypothetical protein
MMPATAERIRHVGRGAVEIVPAMHDADRPEQTPLMQQRIVSAPLDRMYRDGRISQREWAAGDKYRSDSYLAAIDPGAGTVDWNRAGGGGAGSRVPVVFTTQTVADARIRIRATDKAMSDLARTVLSLALIREHNLEEIGQSVFGFRNHRDASASANAGFRVALSMLAHHYGM